MSHEWHGGQRVVRDARETVLSNLETAGRKVVRIRSGEAYDATAEGRKGTLCLHPYSDSPGLWRWHIDHHSVRTRGRSTIISPQPPEGRRGKQEFTCTVQELPLLSKWLPEWIIALDSGGSHPAPPVPMNDLVRNELAEENVWTLKAEGLSGSSNSAARKR